MNSHLLFLAFAMTARRFAMLAMVAFLAVVSLWLIRRQRRLARADLQTRGLVGRHRRAGSGCGGKRNPTLAEIGNGLPPVRQGPPPGPVGRLKIP